MSRSRRRLLAGAWSILAFGFAGCRGSSESEPTTYPTEATGDEEGLEGGTWVTYGTTAFGIGTAVGSRRSSVEFDRVLTLHPSLSAGELTLTVRNDGVDSYEVSHVGRPYFGILLAWDGDHHLLGNEQYAENDHLVTEDGYAYTARRDLINKLYDR